MVTRRAVFVACEERINRHTNEPETIRHRAIVKELRLDDGQLSVYDILLVEDPHGQYTEDGEIWQSYADGGRWRGPTPPHGWQSIDSSFDDWVNHYRWLREQPDGWLVPDRG